MRNPDLWERLLAFEFDKGTGSAPFSVKLAQAEGWSAGFTARVIKEYRRFIYLSQVDERQVTPSQVVDAAWHMHLTFTRDYWDDLCPNVLGKPLHHQPCAGEEEMPRYRQQFAATKALYEAEFREEPPADIWGRDPVRRQAHGFVVDETGAMSGGVMLIIAVAMCVGLFVYNSDLHWGVYAAIIGAAVFLVRVSTPKRRGKRQKSRDDTPVWIEGGNCDRTGDSGTGHGTGNAQGGGGPANKSGTGGFGAMFGGDSNAGSDGAGGCGGCGGD